MLLSHTYTFAWVLQVNLNRTDRPNDERKNHVWVCRIHCSTKCKLHSFISWSWCYIHIDLRAHESKSVHKFRWALNVAPSISLAILHTDSFCLLSISVFVVFSCALISRYVLANITMLLVLLIEARLQFALANPVEEASADEFGSVDDDDDSYTN